ncbi:anaphase-promoting complex subunit cdc27 [Chamberlinius hualienensis]
MLVQEPVQATIWHCLNHYSYLDAIFLAERLYAEVDSDDALFLLATCYFRAGKPGKAYSLLNGKTCKSPQCKFLLARCCMEMNKMNEVEAAITGGLLAKSKPNDDLIIEFEDSASFVLQLLGKICSRTERPKKAAEAYRKSLKLNPFMWSSYEALCNMGENPDPSKIFQFTSAENLSMCQGNNYVASLLGRENSSDCIVDIQDTISVSSPVHITPAQSSHLSNALRPTSDVLGETITPDNIVGNVTSSPIGLRPVKNRLFKNFSGVVNLSPLTPNFGVVPLDTPSPIESEKVGGNLPYIASSASMFIESQQSETKIGNTKTPNVRRNQLVQPNKLNVFTQSCNVSNTSKITVNVSSPTSQPAFQSTAIANVRRSTRLFSSSNSVKENNKTASKNRITSSKTPTKKTKTRFAKNSVSQAAFNEINEINKPETITSENKLAISTINHVFNVQKAAAEGLMSLLRDLGSAYLLLAQYNCKQAVDAFKALPAHHINTGWVLCNLGKAYFELGRYHESVNMFSKAQQVEPHRMEGMEYFSTALWHLQKEVQLSALANELVEFDKNCPQSWCATGNCFSLQKEHDVAIKFFQRAVQVDPMFAYAYTLLGHEFILTEEMDKSMSCFRTAIRIDPKHYNAWYGVGLIYYKQEKYQLAELHYKKALDINPHSSVLMCHVGVVQHALNKSEQALATLNKAIAADPKNPLCKFHRASIYFKTDRHEEALKELEELKAISPTESLVYFQIGKVHRKLGNNHLALMNFSWAMDLDPKGANNQIKEAIDKRYNTEDDDAISTSEIGMDDSSRNKYTSTEVDELQLQAVESDESL